MVLHKVYMNQIHSSSLLRQLSDLWKKKILCDAAVFTGSVEIIKAHRAVLLAASPKLQTMSKNIPIGSCLDVRLPGGVCQSAVKTFLTYLYEGTLTLTDTIVGDVLRIANLLQISSLQKCCEDFYMALERERRGVSETEDKNSCTLSLESFDEFDHVRSSELCQVGSSVVDSTKQASSDAEIQQPIDVVRRKRRKQEQPNPKMLASHIQTSSSSSPHTGMRNSLSSSSMVTLTNSSSNMKTSASTSKQSDVLSYPVALIQNNVEPELMSTNAHAGNQSNASISMMKTTFPNLPNYTVVKSEPDVGKVVDGILSQEAYSTSSQASDTNYIEAVSMSQEQYELLQQSNIHSEQQDWTGELSPEFDNMLIHSHGQQKLSGNSDVSRFARAFKKTKNTSGTGRGKAIPNAMSKLPFTKMKMPKTGHMPTSRGRPSKLSRMKVPKASHMSPNRGRPPKLSRDVLDFIDNLVKVEPYITLIGIQKKIGEHFTGDSRIISITTINRALRDHLKLFKRIPRSVSHSLYEETAVYSQTGPSVIPPDASQTDGGISEPQLDEQPLQQSSENSTVDTSPRTDGAAELFNTVHDEGVSNDQIDTA